MTRVNAGLAFELLEGAADLQVVFRVGQTVETVGKLAGGTATGTDAANPATTLVDAAANVAANFAGYTLRITAGPGAGQERRIVRNTATTFTVDANWDAANAPGANSRYSIVATQISGSVFQEVTRGAQIVQLLTIPFATGGDYAIKVSARGAGGNYKVKALVSALDAGLVSQTIEERVDATNPTDIHALRYSSAHAGDARITENSAPHAAIQLSGFPEWVEPGPAEIVRQGGLANVPPFPQAGAVEAIAVHPFNDQVIYVGSVNGGAWRTEDAGKSWKPLTDQFPSLSIGAITIASHDVDGQALTSDYMGTRTPTPRAKLVVYAGTGQFSAQGEGGLAIGLLKSHDGGENWELLTSSKLLGLPITAIEANRINGDDVVLVSTLGSNRLEKASSKMSDSPQLVFDDANPDTITRSTGSWVTDGFEPGQTIFVSGTVRNGSKANPGVFAIKTVSPTVLTVSETDVFADETVFSGGSVAAAAQQRRLVKKGAIFRSTDGGASFEETVLFDPGLGVIPFAERIPSGSVTDLVADPHNASRLYAAVRGAGVFRTDDA